MKANPNPRKPGTKPTRRSSLIAEETRRKCYQAKMLGFSYRQIAEQLGLHYTTVAHHVQKYMEELVQEDRTNLRWMMFHRLEELQTDLLPAVKARGKMAARNAEVIVKAIEREAKLLDLDLADQRDKGNSGPTSIVIQIGAKETDSEAVRIIERGGIIEGELVGAEAPRALPAPAEGSLLEA